MSYLFFEVFPIDYLSSYHLINHSFLNDCISHFLISLFHIYIYIYTHIYEYEQTRGDTEGQRSLACCSPQDRSVAHDLVTQKQQNCRNKNFNVQS